MHAASHEGSCNLTMVYRCRQLPACRAGRFALQADPAKQPIHFPQCAFVDCKFDVAKELVCPFASGGAFVETERADCPDFMKVRFEGLDSSFHCPQHTQPSSTDPNDRAASSPVLHPDSV